MPRVGGCRGIGRCPKTIHTTEYTRTETDCRLNGLPFNNGRTGLHGCCPPMCDGFCCQGRSEEGRNRKTTTLCAAPPGGEFQTRAPPVIMIRCTSQVLSAAPAKVLSAATVSGLS
ncbi:uncharacterized protein P884DRAFT_62209 [Thermothelomyces heterothallicus CBS 202.75]|uniref:uncharacterized protein n=1 Tax=Thermothelomyces heterothallicus CBS 202.75 TaxID=1149848 RepID=UPI0037433539